MWTAAFTRWVSKDVDGELRERSIKGVNRTLLLMRHADAEVGLTTDFQRPLSLRGRQQGLSAGHALLTEYMPNMVLCSTAVRAQSTLDLVFNEEKSKPDVTPTSSLYEASVSTALDMIKTSAASRAVEPECVLVIAHEPTMSMLASQLAGPDSEPAAVHMANVGVMTAGVIALEFSSSWQKLGPGGATLTRVMPPPVRG